VPQLAYCAAAMAQPGREAGLLSTTAFHATSLSFSRPQCDPEEKSGWARAVVPAGSAHAGDRAAVSPCRH